MLQYWDRLRSDKRDGMMDTASQFNYFTTRCGINGGGTSWTYVFVERDRPQIVTATEGAGGGIERPRAAAGITDWRDPGDASRWMTSATCQVSVACNTYSTYMTLWNPASAVI